VLATATLAAAAAFPFLFGSCTPGNEITAAESDVVVTLYDNKFDFGAQQTYFLPDTIVHLTGDKEEVDDPKLSRKYDRQIIQKIKNEMSARGYTWVDSAANPDLLMGAGATSTDTYNVYSWYPYYPGWGGCCYYYPYYPTTSVSYAYTTGTIVIVMVDKASVATDPDALPVRWSGTISGVLNDSDASIQQRLNSALPQMFDQSPYLKSNQ
jgi:hypothetical protein